MPLTGTKSDMVLVSATVDRNWQVEIPAAFVGEQAPKMFPLPVTEYAGTKFTADTPLFFTLIVIVTGVTPSAMPGLVTVSWVTE